MWARTATEDEKRAIESSPMDGGADEADGVERRKNNSRHPGDVLEEENDRVAAASA